MEVRVDHGGVGRSHEGDAAPARELNAKRLPCAVTSSQVAGGVQRRRLYHDVPTRAHALPEPAAPTDAHAVPEPLPYPSPLFHFDNSYARDLDEAFHVAWPPAQARAPKLLYLNETLAAELGLDDAAIAALRGEAGGALFAGNRLPEGAQPIAQAYAGHQFGGFSPQLGDGRALLLGEVIDRHGRRRDLAFKGSGRTPFSRGGDGKAAVGPMLREVLIGEALHALGIPTTRGLAVVATGEPVVRDRVLPGAVLTRVAASHLRVGTFQFFAARGDTARVRALADHAIARHDPDLLTTTSPGPERILAFLRAVARRQAGLIARWMGVGFIHGVMNTDNMTISGESIDFGPCAFMEAYDPQAVFSSIDHGGRYAYGNQPSIARWNLARLAETLLPLLDEHVDRAVALATEVLEAFPGWVAAAQRGVWRAKLGLVDASSPNERSDEAWADVDDTLTQDWLDLLHREGVDFTSAWRHLADAAEGREGSLRSLFARPDAPGPWLARWRERACAASQAPAARAAAMRGASPRIIARNHRVEEALAAASDAGDLAPFDRLLQALRRPFDDHPDDVAYTDAAPAEVTARYRTFCGT